MGTLQHSPNTSTMMTAEAGSLGEPGSDLINVSMVTADIDMRNTTSLSQITAKKIFRWMVFLVITCIVTLAYIINLADLSAVPSRFRGFLNTSAGANVMIDDDLSTIKPGSVLNTDADDHVMIHGYKLEKDYFPPWFWNISLRELSDRLYAEKRHRSGKQTLFHLSSTKSGNWVQFQKHIRLYALYDPDDPAVDDLLYDMATLPIIRTVRQTQGYQLKVIATFEDGGRAMLKLERSPGTLDHHYGEIATFHVDRLLGYYRVPPTVGRRVNIMSDLAPLFPPEFQQTINKSEDGRICFTGKCREGCTKNDAVCGTPDSVEVSLMHYLPIFPLVRNPWTYRMVKRKINHEKLCGRTKSEYESNNTFLMDTLDLVYFDMLIDNWDRHNFAWYGNNTNQILFDNGKGFGNAAIDRTLDFYLYKLGGCCLIKKTTFLKFFKLYLGPEKLSEMTRNSLRDDPLAPVLSEERLLSLERRLDKIMLFIKDCLKGREIQNVIIDDISV